MVLTYEDAVTRVKDFISGDDDASLSFIEDMLDTLKASTNMDADAEIARLTKELADNDKAWRTRYRDRFFNYLPEDIRDMSDDNGDIVDDGNESVRVTDYSEIVKEVDD